MVGHHVRWIARGRPAVVALGGGAFAIPATQQLLRENGVTVWLDCPFETVARRVAQDPSRPLARDPEQFQALYLARRDSYSLADVRIPVAEEDAETVVETLLAHPMLR
jgi:shikimate kinase